MSVALTQPAPLISTSLQSLVQSWLAYINQKYPNPTYKLFTEATIYYRDQAHKDNWTSTPSCWDFWKIAKFGDWLKMKIGTATIRMGLFMSMQETWVGRQNPEHKYKYHIWCAALRPAPAGIKGKELIFWDNNWERTRARMMAESKRMIAVFALIGGQYKLYQHLKQKGKMNIYKIWIGGNGEHDLCLSKSVGWLGEILENGGLDGDLESVGFYNIGK
ncbi:hypothetical protein L211DRAFT_105094 [Terfezia boudieri ATCC MYA-4762]|uniref:Uncharacterized protein n=1 Tax=Terfezia boudieri ATCC MYA-4762 TaxID=1051890 RepID=A0A3N4LVL3_9PEZI|nr:hypothetical protein L211DRAFT_105094 [Terfezia boudieri ATCC MYA-4762]